VSTYEDDRLTERRTDENGDGVDDEIMTETYTADGDFLVEDVERPADPENGYKYTYLYDCP
jgi:hypothetical protein